MTEITGFPNYLIYEDGRVWSKKSNIFMKHSLGENGYYSITVCENGKEKKFLLSRLLALQFIPNPNNYLEVDHIDRNTLNNSLANLRWATASQQKLNRDGYSNTGEKHISKIFRKDRNIYLYVIYKKYSFRKTLRCHLYTLQDAIILRDALLGMDAVVELSE